MLVDILVEVAGAKKRPIAARRGSGHGSTETLRREAAKPSKKKGRK